MKLTKYDLGQASPADLKLTSGRRVSAIGKHSKKSHSMPITPITPEERQARHAVLMRAVDRLGSMMEVSRALGLNSGSVSGWVREKYPVPEKHMAALERLAE